MSWLKSVGRALGLIETGPILPTHSSPSTPASTPASSPTYGGAAAREAFAPWDGIFVEKDNRVVRLTAVSSIIQ